MNHHKPNAANLPRPERPKPVILAPRCDGSRALSPKRCNRLLAIQVGPGTVIDCENCGKRHEW